MKTLHRQALLRRHASCDDLPTATTTLDRIHNRGSLVQPSPDLSDVFQSASDERNRFEQAMQNYEETVPERLKTNISITATHSWQEVLEAAKRIRDDHYEVTGLWSRITKQVGQLLANNASAALVWAEILPSQNQYFSPICGG